MRYRPIVRWRGERRVHKKGDGIRTRYPRPTGDVLTIEADEWPRGLRISSPEKAAAAVLRLNLHALNYELNWNRYVARGLNVAASGIPERYDAGPYDDAKAALVRGSFDEQTLDEIGVIDYQIGRQVIDPDHGGGQIISGTGQLALGTIYNRLLAQLTPFRFGLEPYGESGFGDFSVPIIYVREAYEDDFQRVVAFDGGYRIEFSGRHDVGPGQSASLISHVVTLLLWGECPRPTSGVTCSAHDPQHVPDDATWLAWYECYAARILLVAGILGAWSQWDDALRLDRGGRGGSGGRNAHGPRRLAATPWTPPVTPRPTNPPESPLARLLGPIIVDAIVAILIAL